MQPQFNTVDQFHAMFEPLIQRYSSPQSICGMTCTANARLIADYLAGRGDTALTAADVEEIKTRLGDKDALLTYVEDMMSFVNRSRCGL
jgi:hypothetical protein